MGKKPNHATPTKFYKVKIGIKMYKVFLSDLKYAKILRKKNTPPLPSYSQYQHSPIGISSLSDASETNTEEEQLDPTYRTQ